MDTCLIQQWPRVQQRPCVQQDPVCLRCTPCARPYLRLPRQLCLASGAAVRPVPAGAGGGGHGGGPRTHFSASELDSRLHQLTHVDGIGNLGEEYNYEAK